MERERTQKIPTFTDGGNKTTNKVEWTGNVFLFFFVFLREQQKESDSWQYVKHAIFGHTVSLKEEPLTILSFQQKGP